MAAKARVNQELFSFPWLCKFEEEYSAGEVVDVGDTEGGEGIG
jgi:hypothetical protein